MAIAKESRARSELELVMASKREIQMMRRREQQQADSHPERRQKGRTVQTMERLVKSHYSRDREIACLTSVGWARLPSCQASSRWSSR